MTVDKNKIGASYIGWDTVSHSKEFDFWNKKCNLDFNYRYGCFSEQQYLLEASKIINNPEIVDIGCATGTTYRFLRNKIEASEFSYKGIDLSIQAIERARSLYPEVNFLKSNGENPIEILRSKSDIVFSRDTILHQENPYEFIDQLLEITKRFLIVRLRTRDHGETEFDISKSCQMHYDSFWMPYIVLNVEELISHIKKNNNVVKIKINKSYEPLGGHNKRFLPKDLYFKKTGTAETSMMIELDSRKQAGDIELIYDDKIQGHEFLKKNRRGYKTLIYRLISKLISR